ncbi:dol-P-Glc:Glc(2)Man(9)GlcNAc(2)-PP-Dol alpha-1,2-glucosyltransferase isoform 3-T3 [Cyanocitta cristata]
MERAEAYGFSGALSGAFLLSCLLFAAVSRRQRGPYMDEVFHVPQAQAYCHGRFLQWDPMITTLPGLYLLSVGVVKPAAWLLGWTGSVVCSVGMLRFINLLFSAGNFYLLYLLLFKIHQKNKKKKSLKRMDEEEKSEYYVFINRNLSVSGYLFLL